MYYLEERCNHRKNLSEYIRANKIKNNAQGILKAYLNYRNTFDSILNFDEN